MARSIAARLDALEQLEAEAKAEAILAAREKVRAHQDPDAGWNMIVQGLQWGGLTIADGHLVAGRASSYDERVAAHFDPWWQELGRPPLLPIGRKYLAVALEMLSAEGWCALPETPRRDGWAVTPDHLVVPHERWGACIEAAAQLGKALRVFELQGYERPATLEELQALCQWAWDAVFGEETHDHDHS